MPMEKRIGKERTEEKRPLVSAGKKGGFGLQHVNRPWRASGGMNTRVGKNDI